MRGTRSSSRNAVSFSSARTMKRFPSSRCASAIQIARPPESTAETQPQLQPALLRLSAIISQYFTSELRNGFAGFLFLFRFEFRFVFMRSRKLKADNEFAAQP